MSWNTCARCWAMTVRFSLSLSLADHPCLSSASLHPLYVLLCFFPEIFSFVFFFFHYFYFLFFSHSSKIFYLRCSLIFNLFSSLDCFLHFLYLSFHAGRKSHCSHLIFLKFIYFFVCSFIVYVWMGTARLLYISISLSLILSLSLSLTLPTHARGVFPFTVVDAVAGNPLADLE
jgi:hypothetical protein